MPQYIEFSYPIGPDTTVMETGLKPPAVLPRSRIAGGRHSNTSYLELFAHTGTHIDAPWHFIEDGMKIEDMSIEAFVFSQVLFLEIPAKAQKPLPLDAFTPHQEALEEADCLLVYSGFSALRSTRPQEYTQDTPGLSLEAADYLGRFAGLRCIGVDFISIENVQNGRQIGFPVHHTLLGRSALTILLEDANLDLLRGKRLSRVFLFPLRMHGIEASPVTAVAEVEG